MLGRATFTHGHFPCIVVGHLTMATTAARQEYDVRVDAKKRVTIRGASHKYFHVVERKDGSIVMKPRVEEEPVSEETAERIGKALQSIKAGKRSKPVDLKKLATLAP
jgi:hypothetical protein